MKGITAATPQAFVDNSCISTFQKDHQDLSVAAARPVGDTLRQTCQGSHDDGRTSHCVTNICRHWCTGR